MTANEKHIINIIFHSLETYALRDIKFLLEAKKPIAGFILRTCLIEQISHFVYGPNGRNKDKAIDFINEYLNAGKDLKYSASELVDILRNKLVHNYSLSDTRNPKIKRYALNYDNPKTHLHNENNVTYVNIDCFVKDIETAMRLYRQKIDNDSQHVKNAIRQFNQHGILIHREEQLFNIKD
jgi:hypothetical protein